MAHLAEKYRPQNLSDLVGQEDAVGEVRGIIEAPDFDGGAFWIEGATGTGKTTMVRCIAERFGIDKFCTEEVGGDECGIDYVRALRSKIRLSGWGSGGWRCFIVNEAHAMTAGAIQVWLTLLEALPPRRLVMFTTTEGSLDMFGAFTHPFLDRTWSIRLREGEDVVDAFAERAMQIAEQENLVEGVDLEDFRGLVRDCRYSMRATLGRLQKGAMRVGGFTPEKARPRKKKIKEWKEVKHDSTLRKNYVESIGLVRETVHEEDVQKFTRSDFANLSAIARRAAVEASSD